MQIEYILEHMRVQVGRQRKEILQLQRAGIGTASAELLLGRILAKTEGLCDERDRLKKEQGAPARESRPHRFSGPTPVSTGCGRRPMFAPGPRSTRIRDWW
jgi:hypothetical protein